MRNPDQLKGVEVNGETAAVEDAELERAVKTVVKTVQAANGP